MRDYDDTQDAEKWQAAVAFLRSCGFDVGSDVLPERVETAALTRARFVLPSGSVAEVLGYPVYPEMTTWRLAALILEPKKEQ